MAGYSSHWDCRICAEKQDSVDTPRMMVCDKCVASVARLLCKRGLGIDLATPGVDERYWTDLAANTIAPMMMRWPSNIRSG